MARTAPAEPWRPAPATRTLVTLAAAVVVLAGVHAGQAILAPALLAAVFVIVCHPLRHPLERRGWPSWAATAVVIAVAYAAILALAGMLLYAGVEFAGLLGDISADMKTAIDTVTTWLASVGITFGTDGTLAAAVQPAAIAKVLGDATVVVMGTLTAFFFVLAYIIFMAADGGRYTHAESEVGEAIRPVLRRVHRFTTGVRRYYVVNAIFGAIVAVADGLALWALHVPAPIVWAILSFVTNFIPNIGFVLGMAPPAVLALIVGGWPLALSVVAIYIVLNVTLQVLVQPKFVSDAVELSLTLSFMSVVFWTFVIGPLGAILAIPLTLLARTLLIDGDPGARWLRWLSGDRSDAGG